ncbi:PH domain-containing protein [Marinobacter sp. F3R08]|uniref:PH domain-containing protein n=1 Tax=Marinobacter sp. F3R08 TaxID=2841559 RepID=UPI001C090E10|nr:PH domain-containing protein [Marinobacter sp. F3R08]MBU2952198.1 PH domain-containing protein [Marinobacter sp. F3R08]
MTFNRAAFTTNTAIGWLLKASLLVLGVALLAPPESLVRVGFAWMKQNPAGASALLTTVVLATLLAAYYRSKTLRVNISDLVIDFEVGTLVRKRQRIKLADIRNIKSHANLIEQKLSAATLKLETVGTGGVDMTLPQLNAEDAEELRQRLSPRGNDDEDLIQAA